MALLLSARNVGEAKSSCLVKRSCWEWLLVAVEWKGPARTIKSNSCPCVRQSHSSHRAAARAGCDFHRPGEAVSRREPRSREVLGAWLGLQLWILRLLVCVGLGCAEGDVCAVAKDAPCEGNGRARVLAQQCLCPCEGVRHLALSPPQIMDLLIISATCLRLGMLCISAMRDGFSQVYVRRCFGPTC